MNKHLTLMFDLFIRNSLDSRENSLNTKINFALEFFYFKSGNRVNYKNWRKPNQLSYTFFGINLGKVLISVLKFSTKKSTKN